MGPTASSSCGTEVYDHVGVVVSSYLGNPPGGGADSGCLLRSTQPVTIDGVSGLRTVATQNPAGPSCGSDGSVSYVAYTFQVGPQIHVGQRVAQQIFLVRYYQFPGDPDLTSEIDTMMNQTWRFLPAG
ncbi:MAG: hypothetical protein ACREN2_02545 [Candidatus Dormibacteria bacterium]